jgi:hypothetical protein
LNHRQRNWRTVGTDFHPLPTLMLEIDRLRASAARLSDFESVVGTDPKMRVIFATRYAASLVE